ncbi:uncharacterized protein [Musca autumnalis]|uniref:uncharacterized protein n=1 Tax=Musca autumnalis TaxID=221902 RepID=UPI003CE767F1
MDKEFNIKTNNPNSDTPSSSTMAMNPDNVAPRANNQSLGGDVDRTTVDSVNDAINKQSRELLELLRDSDSLRLSQESPPPWDWESWEDDEMDITIIPSQSSTATLSRALESSNLTVGDPAPSGAEVSVDSDKPPLNRQDALVEDALEEDTTTASPKSPSTKANKSRQKKDRYNYRRAVFYCQRFIGKDPSEVTQSEFREIGLKIRFVRRFERKYPHIEKIFLPIDQIPTPVEAAVSSPAAETKATSTGKNANPVLSNCSSPLRTSLTTAVGSSRLAPPAPKTTERKGNTGVIPSVSKLAQGRSQPQARQPPKVPPMSTVSSVAAIGPAGVKKGADLVGATVQRTGQQTTVKPSSPARPHPSDVKGGAGTVKGHGVVAGDGPSTSKQSGYSRTSAQECVKRVRSSEDPHPVAKRVVDRRPTNLMDPRSQGTGHMKTVGAQPGRASKADPSPMPSRSSNDRTPKPASLEGVIAPENLRVAIINKADLDGRISDTHWIAVERLLRKAITSDEVDAGKTGFGRAVIQRGIRILYCQDEESRDFLIQLIEGAGDLWDGCMLAAVPVDEIPRRSVATTWVPPPDSDAGEVVKMLRKQNRGLSVDGWRLLKHFKERDGMVMRFTIDDESADYIRDCGGVLFFGSGGLRFRLSKSQ